MSHYRTFIYERTKARLDGANIVGAQRVTIERVEPVTCRTAAEAAEQLPVINIKSDSGRRERTTDAAPLKGTALLEVEVLVTGATTQEVAAGRDDALERIENALLGDLLAWTQNKFKVLAVEDRVSLSQDGDVLTGFAKLIFTLEISTVPVLQTEDMVERIDVDVQTMEPDDETTEMSFTAEPEVQEAA